CSIYGMPAHIGDNSVGGGLSLPAGDAPDPPGIALAAAISPRAEKDICDMGRDHFFLFHLFIRDILSHAMVRTYVRSLLPLCAGVRQKYFYPGSEMVLYTADRFVC